VIVSLFWVCATTLLGMRLFGGAFSNPATHATLKAAPKTLAANMPTTALKYVKPKYLN